MSTFQSGNVPAFDTSLIWTLLAWPMRKPTWKGCTDWASPSKRVMSGCLLGGRELSNRRMSVLGLQVDNCLSYASNRGKGIMISESQCTGVFHKWMIIGLTGFLQEGSRRLFYQLSNSCKDLANAWQCRINYGALSRAITLEYWKGLERISCFEGSKLGIMGRPFSIRLPSVYSRTRPSKTSSRRWKCTSSSTRQEVLASRNKQNAIHHLLDRYIFCVLSCYHSFGTLAAH